MSRHVAQFASFLTAFSFVWSLAADVVAADKPKARESVVLQVSDDSPKTWNQALNVIENLQNAYGKENVDVKLVALGNGIGILKLDSPHGGAGPGRSEERSPGCCVRSDDGPEEAQPG